MMIFNIQRFSTHDGSGIRTMIFCKGCPLRCQWCSNPESQSFGPSLIYDRRICKQFADCVKADGNAFVMHPEGLEISRSAIKDPMKYRDICASRALTVSGEEKSVETLLAEIEKDIPFYREDGGVTLSGGEPLSQGNDLEVLLQALKNRNIDVAVETSLYVPWDKVERCLGLVGTFLADLKHTNREKFSAYVKGDADIVLKNLEKLDSMKENIIIRIPVVAGFNHTIHEMRDIIDFATTLNTVSEIHFLPYHTLGTEKYNMLGMEYTYSGKQPFEAELTEYIDYAHTKGFNVKIGG